MEHNQSTQQLHAENEYQLKRQKKLDEQKLMRNKETLERIVKIALAVILAGGGISALGWYIAKQPQTPASGIISQSGIHWHPELSIYVKGVQQEIPANIGIGVTHHPIHTHDASGVIHLEFQGVVRQDNLKLGNFFTVWGKPFNSNCVLENCNGSDGTVAMFVNGKENTEFENYQMKDGDTIEIRYE